MAELDIDAAVINHPKEIYYFTGIIIPEEFPGPPALLWLGADGRSLLIAHTDEGEPCADECFTFSLSVGGTVTPRLARGDKWANRRCAARQKSRRLAAWAGRASFCRVAWDWRLKKG